MEKNLEDLHINDRDFNDEVIWDSSRPLFDLYFKQKFYTNRYRLALYQIDEYLDFAHALNILYEKR